MQSTLKKDENFHVAVIMDGNGRWATSRGLPRIAGHRVGGQAVRRVVEAAPSLGITALTLFAFSSDNWRRPASEVNALMALFRRFLKSELPLLLKNGIRLTVIGRRDRLPDGLAQLIAHIEAATASGATLHLRIAIDYSSREAIRHAAQLFGDTKPRSQQAFSRLLCDPDLETVDLVIRTGGEKRLSDFLLWESAYAELWFIDMMWPDFGADDLRTAVTDFARRQRRFGGLPARADVMLCQEVRP